MFKNNKDGTFTADGREVMLLNLANLNHINQLGIVAPEVTIMLVPGTDVRRAILELVQEEVKAIMNELDKEDKNNAS